MFSVKIAPMSNCIEAKFTNGEPSGGQLHCYVDEDNRVFWQEVPQGEQGISIPFKTPEEAASFMAGNARILGYPRRLVVGPDFQYRDQEIMHRTGRVPAWGRIYKADSF